MRWVSVILILLGTLLLLTSCVGQTSFIFTPEPSTEIPPTATAVLETAVSSVQYFQPPEWARGAVTYQLFVRAFTPEGTLAAAAEHLSEVRDLGAEIIMLLPIQPTGEKNRVGSLGSPYSIKDYRAIDPALGTEEDLQTFVDTAHNLGMYVLMDFVANHTAWDNPLITEHPDWYTHNDAGIIVSPNPSWTDVADLNYDDPELRDYMIETSLYWIENFGIDGYRCDASIMVPEDFWRSWRKALKAIDPNLLLLSESDPLLLYQAGFEVAYDWTTQPKFVLAMKAPSLASDLLDYIGYEQQIGDNQIWRLRYLENHDQERIARAAITPEQRELAAGFLMTLPGLPLVYAGQEVGADTKPSLFDPTTVDWAGGDESLRALYTELIGLRKSSPALRVGSFDQLESGEPLVFVYKRIASDQQVLVVINIAAISQQITFDGIATGRDMQTGEELDLSEGLALDGYAYRIIELP